MSLPPKKLGILLSTCPDKTEFRRGVESAAASLNKGSKTYVYCIDEAVEGVGDAQLQSLRERGLVLYACAYGAQRRGLPTNELAVFAGLGVLGDMIAGTDEFLSFTGES